MLPCMNASCALIEASVPEGAEPGLFQQSLGWLDKEGNRIRYTETIYSNSYHGLGVYLRRHNNQSAVGKRAKISVYANRPRHPQSATGSSIPI